MCIRDSQKPLLLICGGREYAVKTDGSLAVGIPDPPVRDIRGSGRCQEQEPYWARAGIVTVSQAQMKETVEYIDVYKRQGLYIRLREAEAPPCR